MTPAARAALPTRWGSFTIHTFDSPYGRSNEGPLLLSRGAPSGRFPGKRGIGSSAPRAGSFRVPDREIFGSLRCDCGEQLAESMRLIGEEREGAVIYLRQEGRGIGLDAKLEAYALQDQGLDTVEANLRLGFPADMREYWEAAQILRLMGRRRVRLLTNNPDKVAGLSEYGIEVAERIPLRVQGNPHNQRYIQTKRDRLGHAI